jgi:hypothetical protein
MIDGALSGSEVSDLRAALRYQLRAIEEYPGYPSAEFRRHRIAEIREMHRKVIELACQRREVSGAGTIKRIVKSAGGQSALARRLHIRPQSIQSWIGYGRVPAERVLEVEDVTGVPRYVIRPDLYPRSER